MMITLGVTIKHCDGTVLSREILVTAEMQSKLGDNGLLKFKSCFKFTSSIFSNLQTAEHGSSRNAM